MASIRDVRRALVAASRRHGRVPDEAEDAAHDILLAALRRGIALDDVRLVRAARASARRHGAFLARSAARRRAREQAWAAVAEAAREAAEATREAEAAGDEGEAVARLPAALRTTLLLLSLGLTRAELRSALGVSDAALRKRIQALRERAPLGRPPFVGRRAGSPGLRRAQVGLVPTLAGRGGRDRLIAVSDVDGHGLIFSAVLTPDAGAATPRCPEPDRRSDGTLWKGMPC